MTDPRPSAKSPSAKAQAPTERESRNAWEDEGGSIDERVPRDDRRADRVVSGRIVQNKGGAGHGYKVELTHEDGRKTDHPCATIREGEAFIRRALPTPLRRNTSRDHPADEA